VKGDRGEGYIVFGFKLAVHSVLFIFNLASLFPPDKAHPQWPGKEKIAEHGGKRRDMQ
jgi:hypothetical protein